jgi:hypothetical protein
MAYKTHTPLTTLDEWLRDLSYIENGKHENIVGLIRGQVSQLKDLERLYIQQAYVSGAVEVGNKTTPKQYFNRKFEQ